MTHVRAPVSYQLIVPVCALILAFLAGLGWYGARFSPLRRALPWSAREVYEQALVQPPMYEILLRARLNEAEFAEYIQRLELTPHTPDRVYEADPEVALSWQPLQEPPHWWTPAGELSDLHVWQSGQVWTFARLEDGVAYIRSFSP
jgi:hypothetical protein